MKWNIETILKFIIAILSAIVGFVGGTVSNL